MKTKTQKINLVNTYTWDRTLVITFENSVSNIIKSKFKSAKISKEYKYDIDSGEEFYTNRNYIEVKNTPANNLKIESILNLEIMSKFKTYVNSKKYSFLNLFKLDIDSDLNDLMLVLDNTNKKIINLIRDNKIEGLNSINDLILFLNKVNSVDLFSKDIGKLFKIKSVILSKIFKRIPFDSKFENIINDILSLSKIKRDFIENIISNSNSVSFNDLNDLFKETSLKSNKEIKIHSLVSFDSYKSVSHYLNALKLYNKVYYHIACVDLSTSYGYYAKFYVNIYNEKSKDFHCEDFFSSKANIKNEFTIIKDYLKKRAA